MLRVVACGSVDDGKSTLLGRLLFECAAVPDDHLAALAADSRRVGTRGGEPDYALLLDGLAAEREQKITIDVAYRYLRTPRRRIIVADAPGHEQYTRNMVTAASTADVALVLVDAQKGITRQTRRHSCIVALLGIRRVALVVNKMDLAGLAQARFAALEADYRAFGRRIGLDDIVCIPAVAVDGDNVARASERMAWHRGPTLLGFLEAIDADDERLQRPFRMPVQRVSRPTPDFRGVAGTVVSGSVEPGARVRVLPSGVETRVARIVSADGDPPCAVADEAITLTFADEVDASRGDVVCAADAPAQVADQFEATVVWMHDAPMLRGRTYWLKLGAVTANATIAPLRFKIDVETFEHLAADTLSLNEIGICDIELDRPIAFEPYAANRDLGGFVLIDRMTHHTVGAGMLRSALRRAQNVHWQPFDVDRRARGARMAQKPCVLWFTGLSGSGKSTIANALEKKLHALGRFTYVLDGDNVRKGLTKDLGFTAEDRVENIRRVAEVAALMADAGLIVLTAFISPFVNERRMARALVPAGEFLEIFVDTPLDVAERRDPKGLYGKARRGEIANFTGIDSPYERPESAEITIDGARVAPDDAADRIIAELDRRGFLTA